MRRRFQFTLRFILLGMAVLAVALGVYVNRFQQRRRFVAAMEALDADVLYYDADDAWMRWMSGWLGEGLVMPVHRVTLEGVTDKDLAALDDAPDFSELAIRGSAITKDGILRISRLRNLESLALDGDRFTIRDLEPLARLTNVRHLAVPDDGDLASAQWLIGLMPHCDIYLGPDWGQSRGDADDD